MGSDSLPHPAVPGVERLACGYQGATAVDIDALAGAGDVWALHAVSVTGVGSHGGGFGLVWGRGMGMGMGMGMGRGMGMGMGMGSGSGSGSGLT